MIQICRAEDGAIVQSDLSLWDLERCPNFHPNLHLPHPPSSPRVDSLEHYICEKTGVPPDAVWAYLSDGRPLKHDNVRELAGLDDQVCTSPYPLPTPETQRNPDTICFQQDIPPPGS